MTTDLIRAIEQEYLKTDLPVLMPGDTVRVNVRIKEGNKERIQGYEGLIIKISGGGLNKTMTVRRVFQGVGVERVFLLHSPKVESISVIRRGQVRRSKLYYLRDRSGKAARIRERVFTKEQMAKLAEKQAVVIDPALMITAPVAAPAPEPVIEETVVAESAAPAEAEAPAAEEKTAE